MEAVLLPVGTEWYAVPVEWVREVVSAPKVAPLVTSPSFVLGLFNLRGQIVPLFDTAAILNVSGVQRFLFAVVVHTPKGPAALTATGLPQRELLGEPIGPSDLHATIGTFKVSGGIAVLLDIPTLLSMKSTGSRDTVLAIGSR